MNKKTTNKLYYLLVALVFGFLGYLQNLDSSTNKSLQSLSSNSSIEEAFKNKQSDLQVNGVGVVIKVLKDDTKGHKHQRFLLRLASNHTLLIAHNIDLAPRINTLKKGDRVEFYGEYEYNKKGGVVHWTHHDPNRRHEDGWLKHQDKIYK